MRRFGVIILELGLSACSVSPATDAPVASTGSNASLSTPLLQPRGNLYSAGQPAASDWSAIAARGITTVINLRPQTEMQGRDEASEVRAAGMDYVEIPVADGASITADNARKLHEAIASANGRPVLVHCASANRAGGLLALMAARHEGMGEAQALEFGRRAGMKSTEAAVREALAED